MQKAFPFPDADSYNEFRAKILAAAVTAAEDRLGDVATHVLPVVLLHIVGDMVHARCPATTATVAICAKLLMAEDIPAKSEPFSSN